MAPETPVTDLVTRSAALAEMMTPEKRADLTVAMVLERAFKYLLEGGETGVNTLRSPFNPDYDMNLVTMAGGRPEHGEDNRQAVVTVNVDGDENPHIIGGLFSGALHGVSYTPGTDTPEDPEPVSAARKSASAAVARIAAQWAQPETSEGPEQEAA